MLQKDISTQHSCEETCSEEKKLKKRFFNAQQEGYQFHQEAVRNNPKLLQWVLKKDYWDYRLPEL
jgi:hypothetical protein